jgi:uncharacterized protein with HEPN domain
MKDDLTTVLDIVLAGRRIARFLTDADEPSFLGDEQKRWAVVSQLSLIGEAVRRLSTDFRDARAQVPWKQIAGMRDRLVHAYDKIDWPLVWITATQDIPRLLAELEPLVPPPPPSSSTQPAP